MTVRELTLYDEIKRLREIIRQYGETIEAMRALVREAHGQDSPSLGRAIADRGLR